MELQFQRHPCHCLNVVLRENQNLEQTQEIKLSDGMPDIGRVLSAWGQVILRGKEWRQDNISLTGGIQVWVLYIPEDGTQIRCIDSWIPLQMRWDLPENTPEGRIRISCIPRYVDARSISARKIMVRAGVTALAEAWCPMEAASYLPNEIPEDVELLRSTYPMRLPREAGEKSFLLDEDLTVPASAPVPEKLMYYTMRPHVTEQKVLGNKLVFRGNGNLHILYLSEEGQLHSWDFELPFSQFSDLDGSYSTDAKSDLLLCPTNVELELDDEGNLRLKCGIVGQYLIDDMEMVELIEDAYSPGRELQLQQEMLELPAILENRRENIYGEQMIPGDANVVTDVQLLMDFPRQRRTGDRLELELPGNFQVLYYGGDGSLQSANGRWTGQLNMDADSESQIMAMPDYVQAQVQSGSSMTAKGDVYLRMTTIGTRGVPMVTGLKLGEPRQPEQNRPSLILRKAGDASLWDIAKSAGSTVDAIRKANGLEAEPSPNQMLLIPVN